MAKTRNLQSKCHVRPALKSRPLISVKQSDGLEELFKVLANNTRLRLLHALVRHGELSVTNLSDTIMMKPQAVSNQLQRLLGQGILTTRREGNTIYYKITDPCVPALLDLGLCLDEEMRGKS